MKQPSNVLDVFSDYSHEMSKAIVERLAAHGESPLYGMMRYFMGFADESLRPVETFGGKRFRSGLCLLIADFYGARSEALDAAVSLELFHNFTLIHDDIVDRDEYRRGRKTVWKLWGDHHAINTGDAQFLLAIGAVSDGVERSPGRYVPILRFLEEQYLLVSEGQYLDFCLSDLPLNDMAVTVEAYTEMIRKKTAVLVGAAAQAAGMAALRPKDECTALYTFGTSLGTAYQLCDDVVSIWGDAELTGKSPRGDLKERKKTLPVLHGLSCMTAADRKRFEVLYDFPSPLTDDAVSEAYELLEKTDAYAHTRARIDHYAQQAKDTLASLAISDAAQSTLCRVVDALLPDVRTLYR